MPDTTDVSPREPSWLDRSLSLFAEVRGGEGATALLMLANIFLLLVCYSVIKTVREPLILLGGGAEVRSYTAAGQAIVLMGFVPLYSWFASRVDRAKLLVGVTLFFLAGIELFALAVSAHVPYVGVAFFIWVGIFNISLVAQFWSYANDIYSTEAGNRLFPIITIGMTAGAPLGSLASGRLFGLGFPPQVILQLSAGLLLLSLVLYLVINATETRRKPAPKAALAPGGGFDLVFGSGYLGLIALLVVLLNVVNTTGEYLIARLLTNQASELAAANPAFNEQAYIGAFTGNYQFWVNVTAFLLQAFVTSRLVKHWGLRAALLALPLIALGGYSIIAAGAGFAAVRWIKTAENATDYSVMNTARQLLWLPTSREEKYKAKQAVDTFFVRGGDVLSAGAVYFGTSVVGMSVAGFAAGNVMLTLLWIGVALLILRRHAALRPVNARAIAVVAGLSLIVLAAAPVAAQDTREEQLAMERAEKAKELRPYTPDAFERRIEAIEGLVFGRSSIYPFLGSVFPGGWIAAGPGYRAQLGQWGAFDVHGAWSIKNYKAADATLALPQLASSRVRVELRANYLDAPKVGFYGVGNSSSSASKTSFLYRTTTIGISSRVRAAPLLAVGGGVDSLGIDTGPGTSGTSVEQRFAPDSTAGLDADPTYVRSHLFAEVDWRKAPGYTRSGGLYRLDWYDYRQTGAGPYDFRRVDAEVQQFLPLLRENWVIALRALASVTDTKAGDTVPYFLMPDLGGSRALRGYTSWRFRDRNRMLLTGEYRWTAGAFVDMALFLDAGKVAARRSEFDLKGLKTSYGIGARFHTPTATPLRLEVARTANGTSLVLAFSPSF